MKIAVWYTGHQICDTVAKSLVKGMPNADLLHVSYLDADRILRYDGHIAYGILRGTAQVFRMAELLGRHWWNVDRGYFDASHFDGYYRISHRGTQAIFDKPYAPLIPLGNKVLVAPPTLDVCEFFGVDLHRWMKQNVPPGATIRYKDDDRPIDWNISGLVTFNSSLGWQALARGIAVRSDPIASTVGSFFIDGPPQDVHSDCEQLFRFMRNNQWTLNEIESGDSWMCLSGMIAEKQSVPMSPPIAS